MRITLLLAAGVAATLYAAPASAQTMPMSPDAMMAMMAHHMANITVQATGQVDYAPDIARVTLGVNSEAASAAGAAGEVNARATAVITALKALGISADDIQTSGYSLYYRQATDAVRAAFVATESIAVKTSVERAGAAIDAAIKAGANQTYGLTYDTSRRDELYKEALQRAVKQARDVAQIAAAAAGIKLGSVLSVNIPAAYAQFPSPIPLARLSMAAAPPPIEPGTGHMSATVTVSFGIAGGQAMHP